jgi:steroid 5-alpha reductase family enzyme
MPELQLWLLGLAATVAPALICWLVSVPRRDVSLVDRVWSLLFVSAALIYAIYGHPGAGRLWLTLGPLLLWAVRLAVHITVRNWGHGEDRRYQKIRRNHEPGFAAKSLYVVFGPQAILAWIISLPLLGSLLGQNPPGWRDLPGCVLWLAGFAIEFVADLQLARFRADPANRGAVMDRGLWRYSRHPNYFGECCLWWGFYLLALAAGAWWSIVAPVLMTVLLLRVSGVTLLEEDISERRPAYRDYVARTSAFLMRPPRPLRAPSPSHAGTSAPAP